MFDLDLKVPVIQVRPSLLSSQDRRKGSASKS